MAKISNKNVYIPKEFLDLKDYFVITDSENFKRTKTVESKHVLNFINKYSGNPNSIFIYSNIQDEDYNLQTDGYFFSEANQENPELVSKLYFNFKNIFGEYITPLFQVIIESGVVAFKMINTDNSDNFVYIKPSEILVYEDYFEFDSEVISNLCSGNFINGNHYVVHFELYGGANSDQDNIKKEILIDCPAEITPTAFASVINALAAFSVSDKEIPTFKAVSTGAEPVTYYVELLNIGKGDYGTGQTQLEASNIKVTSFGITASDIEELPSTQIINLEINSSNVVDTINNQNPALIIQDQNEGYVIIKGTFEDTYREYLWLGTGGIYGLGELQAVESDLKELEAIAPTVNKATPSYSGTVKTNTYNPDPVVYLKEEVDAIEEVQNNRISDLEFPDIVLENGTIDLDGLDLDVDGYKWRLNQVEFLNPTPFSTTLTEATEDYFRYDLLQGDNTGNYSIKQGDEDETSADIPTVDVGKIALAVIAIEGDAIVAVTPPDLTSLEARVTDLENRIPVPANGFTGEANAIWSGTGLTYNVITSTYYLNGILYPAINTTVIGGITLNPSDSTHPRFDAIIADINGANKETGVAEENPAAPTLDPNFQLLITNVLILAGATTPANTSQSLIYDEGVEWDTYANNGNITFDNTTTPLSGTYCIDVASSVNNTYFELEAPVPQNVFEADGVKLWAKVMSAIPSNRGFKIAFYNGITRVSKEILFKRGNNIGLDNSFSYTNTDDYQLIALPYHEFDFESSQFTKVRITFINTISVKFDYIALMTSGGGFGTTPDKKAFSKIITDDGIASATTAEDSVVLTGKNGTEVKAIGKTISIDAGQLNIVWHKFPWTDTGDITITGTTVTSTAGIFEADMVGAKIKVGDLDFIISSYSSATSVQVVSNPYGTVTGPNGSWGVYNKAIEVTDAGSLNLYGTSSNIPATMYSESTMILPNLVHTIGSLIGITADSFQLTSGVPIVWRSGDLATDGSRDVGIKRNATGVLEIFDGITAGQFRDMVVRNISGSTAIEPEHYVPLAQMEDADADVLDTANAYTDAGLSLKLNTADYNDRYKGKYTSLGALETAHPTANAGDYAQVDAGSGSDVVNYNYDLEEGWIEGGSGSGATDTDALPEGSSNLYFTTARVLATALAGLSAASGTFTSSDSILTAFGKIKYLIDNIASVYATLASPSFTGTPTAPTATTGTNTTQIATTAFVLENTKQEVLSFALSDETSNLTVGNLITFRMPFAMTLTSVRASVNTAPTVSSIIVDVKESGASIFSTLLSIDATEKTSVTAATPAVISDTSLADDAEITISTTQIGSGVAGNGLKITLIGTRT